MYHLLQICGYLLGSTTANRLIGVNASANRIITVKYRSSGIDKACEPLYFVVKSNTMKLVMYLGNDLIEAVPVEPGGLSKPGYLGNFKRVLKLKYKDLLSQVQEPPEFFVVDQPQSQSSARA